MKSVKSKYRYKVHIYIYIDDMICDIWYIVHQICLNYERETSSKYKINSYTRITDSQLWYYDVRNPWHSQCHANSLFLQFPILIITFLPNSSLSKTFSPSSQQHHLPSQVVKLNNFVVLKKPDLDADVSDDEHEYPSIYLCPPRLIAHYLLRQLLDTRPLVSLRGNNGLI